MSNVLRNLLGIFVLAMTIIALVVVYSISTNISTNIYNISNTTYHHIDPAFDDSSTSTFLLNQNDALETVQTGINFLVVMIVVLTLYSSFVSQTSISSYLLTFVASVLMSGVIIYIFHNVYNSLVLASVGSILDFTTFTDFIFVNFDNIILLNVIASLLSFIFKKTEAARSARR